MQRERVKVKGAGRGKSSEIHANRADIRRAQYASDPIAADAQRSASREKYHQGNRPAAKLANGLLTRGEVREVIAGEMDHPVAVESFTIPQAAEALGRGVATIRRWLAADRIPEPYLEDVSRHHKVYSVGELNVIAGVIAQHEQAFVYFVAEHTHIIESLHQAVHAYRAEYL